MINLILCVLITTILFSGFKVFAKLNIPLFPCIVINYLTAGLLGYFSSHANATDISMHAIFIACSLGILFITVFSLIGYCSQTIGVSITTVAVKASMIIPIVFSILYYKDSLSILKIIGILLTLTSVLLISINPKGGAKSGKISLLPVLLFVGSGLIDLLMKVAQSDCLLEGQEPIFTKYIFTTAFTLGILFLIFKLVRQEEKLRWACIPGGILLGTLNYYSIYFFIRSLQLKNLAPSVIFTLNNNGIILCTAFAGIIFFRERLSKLNYAGIFIALIAILFLSFA